jgi:hypothetical protein
VIALPDSVVADLIAAEIPWAAGMLDAAGDRVEVDGEGNAFTYGSWGDREDVVGPPNAADRATFLLLCDLAEARGVTELDFGDGTIALGDARRLDWWRTFADDLIAALARALREAKEAR